MPMGDAPNLRGFRWKWPEIARNREERALRGRMPFRHASAHKLQPWYACVRTSCRPCQCYPPVPLARATLKFQKFDGNSAWCCSADLPLASAKPASTQASLGPTEPCTRRIRFLLSSGCGWGRYYRVAHSTGPIPNETRISCRTLAARLLLCQRKGVVHAKTHAATAASCMQQSSGDSPVSTSEEE
jgi:hypothetical protein